MYDTRVGEMLSRGMKETNVGWRENWRRGKGCGGMLEVYCVVV